VSEGEVRMSEGEINLEAWGSTDGMHAVASGGGGSDGEM
jgi:hypothetical protein